jgi:hypothetical protein
MAGRHQKATDLAPVSEFVYGSGIVERYMGKVVWFSGDAN